MRLFFVMILCAVISIQLAAANENVNLDVNKTSPAENLANAKRFIKGDLPNTARTFLDAIPKTAPEYKEAKRLYAKLPALQKKEEAEDRKFRAAEQIEERKNFAKYYETELQYKGIRGSVSTQGKSNTTLKIISVLVNRLENDKKLLAELRRLNFKKLVLSDGATLTTISLN